MKRLLLMILLLCPALTLPAASWSPSAGIDVLYDGTAYHESIDSAGMLRSSIGISARIDAAAISFGRHRISLPIRQALISESSLSGRTKIQARTITTLSLEYGYAFSEILALSASLDASYIFYMGSRAASWSTGATITPSLSTGSIASIAFPVALSYGKGMFGISAGIGLRIGGSI